MGLSQSLGCKWAFMLLLGLALTAYVFLETKALNVGVSFQQVPAITIRDVEKFNSTAMEMIQVVSMPPQVIPVDTTPRPVIHFLFMCYSFFPHMNIWKDFFSEAQPGTYRLWLRCVMRSACVDELDNMVPFPGLTLVEDVPSDHWISLMWPELKLLQAALRCREPHPMDHFVLIDHATLPLKPFWAIYEKLTSSNASHLCIRDVAGMRWILRDAGGDLNMNTSKTTTWWTLNVDRAQALLRNYVPQRSYFLMPWPHGPEKVVLIDMCLAGGSGSIDEYQIHGAIYADRLNQGEFNQIHDEWILVDSNSNRVCATAEIPNDGAQNLPPIFSKDPGFVWGTIGTERMGVSSLEAIRDSGILFGRRFDPTKGVFPEWSRVVLNMTRPRDHSEALPAPAECAAEEPLPFVLHFLFLLSGEMPERIVQVWKRFLREEDFKFWEVLATCLSDWCKKPDLPRMRWVEQTPVTDPMSALVAMLKVAIRGVGWDPDEKFVVVTGDTVPIVPFQQALQELQPSSAFSLSDMCFKNHTEWIAWPAEGLNVKEGTPPIQLPRHSKFMVLSRTDAQVMVKVWVSETGGPVSILTANAWWAPPGDREYFMRRVILSDFKVNELEVAPFFLIYGLLPDNCGKGPPLTARFQNVQDSIDTMKAEGVEKVSRCRTLDLEDDTLVRAMVDTASIQLDGAAPPRIQSLPAEVLVNLTQRGYLFVAPISPSAELGSVTAAVSL